MNLESIDDKTTCFTSARYSLNSIYLLLEKLTDIEKINQITLDMRMPKI